MNIRKAHNIKNSMYFIIAMLLHLPAFIYLAYANNHSYFISVGLPLFIISMPYFLYLKKDSTLLLPNIIAIAAISFSGLLIHLGNGMIEMHFHIFIILSAGVTPILLDTVKS